MDAAFTTRAIPPLPSAAPRADAAPVREAVKTDLAQPDQSVAAMRQTMAGRMDDDTRMRREAERNARRNNLTEETARELEREMTYDEQAEDMIVRTLDPRTGEVVNQSPPEAILKMRAYVREIAADHAQETKSVARSA